MKLNKQELLELKKSFYGELNSESDDPLSPVDVWRHRNLNDDTCLHIAVSRSDYRAVELLIKGGIDVNALGSMGRNALHCARRKGDERMISLLIDSGVEQNVMDEFGKFS